MEYKTTIEKVGHTEQVLLAIDDVVQRITAAESSQRGYLLTGQDPYLQPFRQRNRS